MIVVTGQTATGKTKYALKLAKENNGELINCDARQVYQDLNIITGKDLPSNSKFHLVKTIDNFAIGYYHINQSKIWLYDVLSPKKSFSSFWFVKLAKIVIEDLKKEGKNPILVGGSYFYLKHLLYGFDIQVPPNPALRQKLKNKSVEELQQILKEINPKIFNQLNQSDRANPHRLLRKIEIALSNQSNKSYKTNKTNIPYPIIGLRFADKKLLITAIKKRVEERLKKGAIEEVENLLKKGYQPTDPGLNTIGYKQIINYLLGKTTKEEAINQWIVAEVKYAKSQLTFMKKDKNIKWVTVTKI